MKVTTTAVALLSLLAPLAVAIDGEEGLQEVICNKWPKAPRDNLDKAIAASNVPGRLSVGYGKSSFCRRNVGTPKTGTALWICNDADNVQHIKGELVHLAADRIREECGADDYSGQIFHEDKWNIILRADDPDKPVQTPVVEIKKKKARKHRKNKN